MNTEGIFRTLAIKRYHERKDQFPGKQLNIELVVRECIAKYNNNPPEHLIVEALNEMKV